MSNRSFNLNRRDFAAGEKAVAHYNTELFSFLSEKYDTAVAVLSFGRDRLWKDFLVASLPDFDRPRCVDLGCGTGDLSSRLARKYPAGHILGLDLTPAMVRQARSKNPVRNGSYTVQDMLHLGVRAASVDVATAGYSLRNTPDLSAALREIRRILKPSGTLGLLEFSRPRSRVLQLTQLLMLRFWGFLLGAVLMRNTRAFESIPETLTRFPDQLQLASLLQRMGFEPIESKRFFPGFTKMEIWRKKEAKAVRLIMSPAASGAGRAKNGTEERTKNSDNRRTHF